jgi:hypothetical protein
MPLAGWHAVGSFVLAWGAGRSPRSFAPVRSLVGSVGGVVHVGPHVPACLVTASLGSSVGTEQQDKKRSYHDRQQEPPGHVAKGDT